MPREGELRELLQIPNFQALTARRSFLMVIIFGLDLWNKLENALVGLTRFQSDGTNIRHSLLHSKEVIKMARIFFGGTSQVHLL